MGMLVKNTLQITILLLLVLGLANSQICSLENANLTCSNDDFCCNNQCQSTPCSLTCETNTDCSASNQTCCNGQCSDICVEEHTPKPQQHLRYRDQSDNTTQKAQRKLATYSYYYYSYYYCGYYYYNNYYYYSYYYNSYSYYYYYNCNNSTSDITAGAIAAAIIIPIVIVLIIISICLCCCCCMPCCPCYVCCLTQCCPCCCRECRMRRFDTFTARRQHVTVSVVEHQMQYPQQPQIYGQPYPNQYAYPPQNYPPQGQPYPYAQPYPDQQYGYQQPMQYVGDQPVIIQGQGQFAVNAVPGQEQMMMAQQQLVMQQVQTQQKQF